MNTDIIEMVYLLDGALDASTALEHDVPVGAGLEVKDAGDGRIAEVPPGATGMGCGALPEGECEPALFCRDGLGHGWRCSFGCSSSEMAQVTA